MNIRDKKIKQEIDEIVKACLVKGYVPTSDEVINMLGQNIITKNMGMPSFSFSHIYKEFSLDKLNRAKGLTADDLAVIFECMVELYNETEKQITKFGVEKEQHSYRTSLLEAELTNMVNKYTAEGYEDSFTESMVDMQNFDPVQTTCDIDIFNNEATLRKLYDTPVTDIQQIKTTFDTQKVVVNGDIVSYIKDNGSVWQAIVTKDVQETTIFQMVLDIGAIMDINKISLVMPLLKPASIKVETSGDYSKWSVATQDTISDKMVVAVTSECRYIRITMTKSEADKYTDSKYQYYFLVDKIELSKINYATQSQMVTTPIKFESNINKVQLVEMAEMPTSTSVEYYVALNSNNPEWVEIMPLNATGGSGSTTVNFNTIDSGKILDIAIPAGISKDALELKALSVNGQNIYSIAELKGINLGKCKLYKGVNAWRRDGVVLSKAGIADKSMFIGNTYTVSTSYKPLPFGKPSLIMNAERFTSATVLKYSTMVNCPSGKIVKAPIVSNFPLTIYLNGNIVYQGMPEKYTAITYSFKQGKNVLEVVVNVNSLNQTTYASASVDLNLDIKAISTFICAEPDAQKQVSLFNLRYNTNNQKNVYAIKKTNSGYAVVVKDGDVKISYRLVYDEILEEAKELLLKAVLKKEYDAVNITPRLKGYELRVM